jgi:hypothetical protein
VNEPKRNTSQLIHYRLELLERAVGDISGALNGIKDSLQQLAVLETRHMETREALERAFSLITNNDKRIAAIEKTLPVLKLTSGWVRTGVIGVCALVLLAVGKLVIGK